MAVFTSTTLPSRRARPPLSASCAPFLPAAVPGLIRRLLRLPPDGFTGFEFLSVAGREVRKAHFTELKCKFDVRAGQMRLEGKVRCA